MWANTNLVSFFSQPFTRSIAGLILLGTIALSLSGCSENEGGGPILSSLSTPTEAPSPVEGGQEANTDSSTPGLSEENNQAMDLPGNDAEDSEDSDAFANLAEPSEVEDPEISLTAPPSGVTVQLTWDASNDPNVQGYFIHYGKQSPGEYGSCSYEQSQRVGPPPATITDLDPNSVYFFAISAFGESESEAETACSNEIVVTTPAVQG